MNSPSPEIKSPSCKPPLPLKPKDIHLSGKKQNKPELPPKPSHLAKSMPVETILPKTPPLKPPKPQRYNKLPPIKPTKPAKRTTSVTSSDSHEGLYSYNSSINLSSESAL